MGFQTAYRAAARANRVCKADGNGRRKRQAARNPVYAEENRGLQRWENPNQIPRLPRMAGERYTHFQAY